MVNQKSKPRDLISPNEAARILGVTGETVRRYLYNGDLEGIQMSNGHWLLDKNQLEGFKPWPAGISRGDKQ